MRVADLIAALTDMPPDSQVLIAASEYGYLDVGSASLRPITLNHYSKDGYVGDHEDGHVHEHSHDLGPHSHFHDEERVLHDIVNSVVLSEAAPDRDHKA